MKYLGILVDSVSLTLTLPLEKMQVMLELLNEFSSKKVASKKELQRLAGNLAHCATIVRAGRTFSRRIINLVKGFPTKYDRIRLSNEFFADIRWWTSFMAIFNGTGKIISHQSVDLSFYTDASGSGFGGYISGSDYCFGSWDNRFVGGCSHVESCPHFDSVLESISQKELWPILVMCKRFGKMFAGKHVCVFTDNQAVQVMVNTGRSRETHTMSMLRELFWVCFINNISLTSRYVKGLDNVKADFLSRLSSLKLGYLIGNVLFSDLFSCCRRCLLNA